MDAIVLQGLSKTYMNGKRAVNRISFSLKQGEEFGDIGPNGAGKKTQKPRKRYTLFPG